MGPWSRSFIAAVAGNAERPDVEVRNLRVEPGVISATVEGREVTLTAHVIPPRIWESVERFARGMGPLEDAIGGRAQSVHLEHLLEEDWGEQLIPRRGAIQRFADSDLHLAAVALAVADEIERSPRVLLNWRLGDEPSRKMSGDPWRGSSLQAPGPGRPMPQHAVLNRLGQDELLAPSLRAAYRAFRWATSD